MHQAETNLVEAVLPELELDVLLLRKGIVDEEELEDQRKREVGARREAYRLEMLPEPVARLGDGAVELDLSAGDELAEFLVRRLRLAIHRVAR